VRNFKLTAKLRLRLQFPSMAVVLRVRNTVREMVKLYACSVNEREKLKAMNILHKPRKFRNQLKVKGSLIATPYTRTGANFEQTMAKRALLLYRRIIYVLTCHLHFNEITHSKLVSAL